MQYYVIPFKRAGGLHKNYSEIDFLIVSDRGDWYISHRKILLLAEREVIACRKSALQCNCIASAIFNLKLQDMFNGPKQNFRAGIFLI